MPALCVMRPNGQPCSAPVAHDSRVACPRHRDEIDAAERAFLRKRGLACAVNPPLTAGMFEDDDDGEDA